MCPYIYTECNDITDNNLVGCIILYIYLHVFLRNSPKSPRNSNNPSSPTKRYAHSTPLSPRQSHSNSPKSNSQQAAAIRSKLPFLLRLLSIESIGGDLETLGNDVSMSLDLSQSASHGIDVNIDTRAFDCLGLILDTTASSSSSSSKRSTKKLSEVFPPLSSSSLSMTLQSTGSSQSLISAVEDGNLARSQESIR